MADIWGPRETGPPGTSDCMTHKKARGTIVCLVCQVEPTLFKRWSYWVVWVGARQAIDQAHC